LNSASQRIEGKELKYVSRATHCQGAVAQIPFRSLKRIFDHSNVRFTANPKLALWAQTLDLRPFRFTKNGFQKFFNVRSRDLGNSPSRFKIRKYWPLNSGAF
jgi:hypothetical protein